MAKKLVTLQRGVFTISLDFELHWGVSDTKTIKSYEQNLKNVPLVIDKLLAIFDKYQIHATWATVGFLFCRSKKELLAITKDICKPNYVNKLLSNYEIIPSIGEDTETDPYHYANTIIEKLKQFNNQEIATHTFSHYYCLENGQTIESFNDDLKVAKKIGSKNDIEIKSIVFPRNQYSEKHIAALSKHKIFTYRGNENHWLYQPRSFESETNLRRIFRLIDSYFNFSGYNSNNLLEINPAINIPASRFLRPYSQKLKLFEPYRYKRITEEMTYAAKNNCLYHLWWHPHNFGIHIEKNLEFLDGILKHYQKLNNEYTFESLSMKEVGTLYGRE